MRRPGPGETADEEANDTDQAEGTIVADGRAIKRPVSPLDR